MIKAKPYKGQELKGLWYVTLKVDGVRALWDGRTWVSRAGKPLYNLPAREQCPADDCEVYVGSYKNTISAVRTKSPDNNTPKILPEHMYSLDPIDLRLSWRSVVRGPEEAYHLMNVAIKQGYEGLVLRQENTWLKVKPIETYDVEVIGYLPGKGKHKDKLGALVTSMGNVGTGFTDSERERIWENGTIIEVECMHLTPDGKFRHPRFIRERFDK